MEQASAPSSAPQSAPESSGAQSPVVDAPESSPSLDITAEDVPQEESSSASGQEDTANEPAKEPLKFKRKVNGKIIEATEDELWKHYGLEVAAQEKMQAAAKLRKEAEEERKKTLEDRDSLAQFLMNLKKKPEDAFSLLETMGHDPRLIARQMVLKELEYERMSPAEKRAFDLEQELNALKSEKQAHEEITLREKEQAMDKVYTEQVDTVISEALKLSGLKPKPITVARIAEACQTLLISSKNGELPTPEQIAKRFLSTLRKDAGELIYEQSPEKLIELGVITEDSLKQLVQYHLAKSKKNLPSFGTSTAAALSTKTKEPQKKKIGINEFFNKL
jgi:hypothetical protein